MKVLFVFWSIIFFSTQIRAQNECEIADIHSIYPEDDDAYVVLPLEKWENNYLCWTLENERITIGFTNEEFEFKSQKTLSLNIKGKKHFVEDVILLKNNVYIITSVADLDSNLNVWIHNLFVTKFDIATMSYNSTNKVKSIISDKRNVDLVFQKAKNKEFFMIYVNRFSKKEKQDGFDLIVFDSEMNVVFEKSKIWKGKGSSGLGVKHINLMSNGDVAIVVGKIIFRDLDYSYGYKKHKLYIYSKNNVEPVIFDQVKVFSKRNNFINHDNGDLEVLYLNEKDKLTNNWGYKSIRISSRSYKVISEKFYPWSREIIYANLDPVEKEKLENRVRKYGITTAPKLKLYKNRELIQGEDGEVYFIFQFTNWSYVDRGPAYLTYGDIQILKFDKERNLVFKSQINKYQFSTDRNELGYQLFVESGNLNFIYSDMDTESDGTKYDIYVTVINEKGEVEEKCMLTNSEDEKVFFRNYFEIRFDGGIRTIYANEDNYPQDVIITF